MPVTIVTPAATPSAIETTVSTVTMRSPGQSPAPVTDLGFQRDAGQNADQHQQPEEHRQDTDEEHDQFASGRLVVNRALQRQPAVGYVFVEPKTARSRRTMYLAGGALAALTQHRRRQVADQLAAGPEWSRTGLVFASPVGSPVDGTWTSKRFRRTLDQAGLPRIRVHDLRHTAATHLLRRGVHPKVVQELLGHSTISLTVDTYSHVAPALHVEVAKHMEAMFT